MTRSAQLFDTLPHVNNFEKAGALKLNPIILLSSYIDYSSGVLTHLCLITKPGDNEDKDMDFRFHLTALPLELIQPIFERTTRELLLAQPAAAVAFQLVSRTTRRWLLPIIYYVFEVRLPAALNGITPSLTFFCNLGAEAEVRPHIKHVVLRGGSAFADIGPLPQFQNAANWAIDSAAVEYQNIYALRQFRLDPARIAVFGTGSLVAGARFFQSRYPNSRLRDMRFQVSREWQPSIDVLRMLAPAALDLFDWPTTAEVITIRINLSGFTDSQMALYTIQTLLRLDPRAVVVLEVEDDTDMMLDAQTFVDALERHPELVPFLDWIKLAYTSDGGIPRL
ncbi:hypothetical protein BKA62DRAFT_773911 [Auriculariales sp. MPI-PUGE-AT-0066]|nr:hypothetical protein BKA62DRAFT_773911 [Auriculariales sp. MPI-PUGE-AT-0066]